MELIFQRHRLFLVENCKFTNTLRLLVQNCFWNTNLTTADHLLVGNYFWNMSLVNLHPSLVGNYVLNITLITLCLSLVENYFQNITAKARVFPCVNCFPSTNLQMRLSMAENYLRNTNFSNLTIWKIDWCILHPALSLSSVKLSDNAGPETKMTSP